MATTRAHAYESGHFALREAACLVPALQALATRPALLLIDGHGLAHPRRFGLACYLGVLFDVPTVGCAKALLVGQVAPPGQERGATSAICLDHAGKSEIVGAAVRTQSGVYTLPDPVLAMRTRS